MYEIEKDIPIPTLPGRRSGSMYPTAKLEVGDSFFIPGKTTGAAASATLRERCKFPDRQFTHRAVDGGVRVWRVR